MAASGAPDRNENHAQDIADVSLQLIEHVRSLKLPSGFDIRIRIGNSLSLVVQLSSEVLPPHLTTVNDSVCSPNL